PGVFLQAHETRWHDAGGFTTAGRAINAKPARAQIELTVEPGGADSVQVHATSTLAPAARNADARLFLALTASGIETKSKVSGNRGETLHNQHVTRDWSGALGLGTQNGALTGATPKEHRAVVAFVQDLK